MVSSYSPPRAYRLWGPHSFLSSWNRGWGGQGVRLIIHLHVVPRLRRRRSTVPLPCTSSWSGALLCKRPLEFPIFRHRNNRHHHQGGIVSNLKPLIFSRDKQCRHNQFNWKNKTYPNTLDNGAWKGRKIFCFNSRLDVILIEKLLLYAYLDRIQPKKM
jgi:hypothetical protein